MDVYPGLVTDSFLGQVVQDPPIPFSVAPGNQITVYVYPDSPGILRLI